MKHVIYTLAALVAWASAMPQDPQIPQPISTSITTITVTGQQVPAPAPTEPIPNLPDPVSSAPPAPPAPVPSDPSKPAPPSGGAHCVCGATYCGKVLTGFQGYTTEQVGQGYCSTPGTDCASAAPAVESLQDTLFVCICPPGQSEGVAIELVCPCQGRCKNDEPDFIGRCETPCNLGCAPASPPGPAPTILPAPVPIPQPQPQPQPQPAPAPAGPDPAPAPAPPAGRSL